MEVPMMSFLRGVLCALFLLMTNGWAAAADFDKPTGDVLLTVTGLITATNVDGTLQLDQAQLDALPQTEFTTSTTWTSGTPTFKGVLLKDLIAATGATGGTITLKAANDYAITIPMTDVGDTAPMLAYLMDGATMSLRDKGPVWMVYPYDSDEKFRTEETYSRSIWQLTEIDFSE
jgi:hypothetical protein